MEKTKQGQVGMGQRSLAQETWRRFKNGTGWLLRVWCLSGSCWLFLSSQ